MQAARKLYRYINLLSLDVVLGAVCCTLFFGKLMDVRNGSFELAALALTVWIIYTLDHLLDAKKIQAQAATSRHRFHQRNFKLLVWFLFVVGFTDLVFVYFLSQQIIETGLILALFVSVYLLLQRYVYFLKELIIAILYTAGVLLPVVTSTSSAAQEFPWIIMLQFCLTAWVNLIVFAWYDRSIDEQDGSSSVAVFFDDEKIRVMLFVLVALVLVLTFFSTNLQASYLVAVMSVMQLVIYDKHTYFVVNERYRKLGDAIFLLPIIYLLF